MRVAYMLHPHTHPTVGMEADAEVQLPGFHSEIDEVDLSVRVWGGVLGIQWRSSLPPFVAIVFTFCLLSTMACRARWTSAE